MVYLTFINVLLDIGPLVRESAGEFVTSYEQHHYERYGYEHEEDEYHAVYGFQFEDAFDEVSVPAQE